MKVFVLILTALLPSMLLAEIISGKIHSIENGILKFNNGRVAFLDGALPVIPKGTFIEIEVDERSSLRSLKRIDQPISSLVFKNALIVPEETLPPVFTPTLVSNMDEAINIFNRSNPNYKRISECSDRAHIWAHDEFKNSATASRKAFLFFTASYINSVRLKWWYHVAPVYNVNDNGSIKELVMDYRYTDRPMTVKEWTDQFVFTKRPCKVTDKFSQYDMNPQTENCYLIFESMHYKIPGQIHEKETHSRYKTNTTESELQASFGYAFNQDEEGQNP